MIQLLAGGHAYLAAPPGTGKTSFLTHDLLPAFASNGWFVVCVRTGLDQPYTPGELIADALELGIATLEMGAAPDAPTAALLPVDITRRHAVHWSSLRKAGEVSFVAALRKLKQLTQQPLVLVIDEAQHALNGAPGRAAMAALKAARAELNKEQPSAVRLLCIGSDRERLRLLGKALHPLFQGGHVTALPPLSSAFLHHVVEHLQNKYPSLTSIDVERLAAAFLLFDRRPRPFVHAITCALSQSSISAGGTPELPFEERAVQAGEQYRLAQDARKDAWFLSLPPLEQEILERGYSNLGGLENLFTLESCGSFHAKVGFSVTPPRIRTALTSLKRRTPSPIWSMKFGFYVIDDDDGAWRRWYELRVGENNWPPRRQ